MVIRRPKFSTLAAMVLALLAATDVSASESGILSYRAQGSFNAGRFARGYGQLERALLASRKEADLQSEGRVLLAMAQIRTMSLDLDLADSLAATVREDILDAGTKILLGKVKMAIANERGNHKDAANICVSFDKNYISKADESTQAAFYAECAIAQAASNKDTEESMKMVGKRSDKSGGFYAATAARVAELKGNASKADSLYKVAEKKAIEGNKPYNTATILYRRSTLKTTPKDEVSDLKLRCKNAFDLMGLPNNAKRCAQ